MIRQNEQLTGRVRYRVQDVGFFVKKLVLVLQVEAKWDHGPRDAYGMPEYLPGFGWRDARVEDLPTAKGETE